MIYLDTAQIDFQEPKLARGKKSQSPAYYYKDLSTVHDGRLYARQREDGKWALHWQANKATDFAKPDVLVLISDNRLSAQQISANYPSQIKKIPQLSGAKMNPYGVNPWDGASALVKITRKNPSYDPTLGQIVANVAWYVETHRFKIKELQTEFRGYEDHRFARKPIKTMAIEVKTSGGTTRTYPIEPALLVRAGITLPYPLSDGSVAAEKRKSEFNSRVSDLVQNLHARGYISLDGSVVDLEAEGKKTIERLAQLANLGFLFFGTKKLRTAISDQRTLTRIQTHNGKTLFKWLKKVELSPAQKLALRKANGTIALYTAGAGLGATYYAMYIPEKYFDKATAALAQGKSIEALDHSSKGVLQLLNWTVGSGTISAELSGLHIAAGKYFAAGALTKSSLSKVNWGMFIDPRNWNSSAIAKMNIHPSTLKKYEPVLDWIKHNLDTAVTKTGQLKVPEDVVARLGVASIKNSNDLVKAMIADDFWRAFVSKPVFGTPLVFASTTSKKQTINAYTQLILSRAAVSIPSSMFTQSVNSLAMGGSLSINPDQVIGTFVGSAIRSIGGPGSWVAPNIKGAIGSYAMSSTLGLIGQLSTGVLLKSLKSSKPMSVSALQVQGNVQQASIAIAIWLHQAKTNGSNPNELALVEAYAKALTPLFLAFSDGNFSEARTKKQVLAVESWLNTNIDGQSRREQLNALPLEVKTVEQKHFLEQVRVRNKLESSNSLAEIGVAPEFSKFIPFEQVTPSDEVEIKT
jgi:hypothetical protein